MAACAGVSGDDCTSHHHQGCFDGRLYWQDSCSEYEELITVCACGCADDHSSCKTGCTDCTPDCGDRECGPVPNGCTVDGPDCGTCSEGSCDPWTGTCESSCVPDCSGRQCGPDGCGGTCGQCEVGTCNEASGQCESCVPDCIGKECGPDGCGGQCGPGCQASEVCDELGRCVFQSSCVHDFGNGLTPVHGRLDGFLHYVVLPDDHQCPNDDNHVRLQVRMNGQYYNVAVNIESTGSPDPRVYHHDILADLHGPAWSEGWHTSGVDLDYSSDLDVGSNDFMAASLQGLADMFEDRIRAGQRVSVYMEAYDSSGGHNVHRNDYFADGAIVTGADSDPHYYLFRFVNQVFCDRCDNGTCNPLTGECEYECTPNCGPRECGPVPNGCGDSCGECEAPATCDPSGMCVLDWVTEAQAGELGMGWLTDVFGFGDDDVWAVGEIGIVHRQDGVWTVESVALTDDDSVNAIWGPSPDTLYAAADTIGSNWDGMILDYANSSWTRDDYWRIGSPFFGIWGSGPEDMWIVGYDGIIAHNDGDGWDDFSPYSAVHASLRAVWGANADDFWIVGSNGTILYNGIWGIDYDGSPTNEHLYDLWGSSATDVWAVGNRGTIVHTDGQTGWDQVSSPTSECLYGICGGPAGDVWAVGAGGTVIHNDGGAWRAVPSPTSTQLNACWVNDQGRIWMVGEAGIIFTKQ